MRHGSLFSGIGGFDLAAEWMGWENVFHCEWNEFGQKVLRHYWPDAELFTDITKSNFSKYHGTIDIISGGFPCQPYSMAGKRLGKEDARHLWPYMLEAIRSIRPRWIVGENVFGLLTWNDGLVFHEVQSDLEAEGYEVFAYVLPAVSVNAPHRRDRVWFIAYRDGFGCHDGGDNREKRHLQNDINGDASKSESKRGGRECWTGKVGKIGNATDTSDEGLQRIEIYGSIGGSWTKSKKQFAGLFQPDWEKFPTQSPVCGRNDGISTKLDGITFSKWRQESVKGYGNAIVPQVVYQIFKAIHTYEGLDNRTAQ